MTGIILLSFCGFCVIVTISLVLCKCEILRDGNNNSNNDNNNDIDNDIDKKKYSII